jgi:hypothetical protein
MEPVGVSEIEDLAVQIAKVLAKGKAPQTTQEVQAYARTLAVLQSEVIESLKESVQTWTLAYGPVYLDVSKDQAYGHWDKKTTAVKDENGLYAFLADKGSDPDNYKRPDLVKLKVLLTNTNKETMAGIEQFVALQVSQDFGFKKNLINNPRVPKTAAAKQPTVHVGPEGVVEGASVVEYTPAAIPAARKVSEEKSVVGCGVMPPVALVTK